MLSLQRSTFKAPLFFPLLFPKFPLQPVLTVTPSFRSQKRGSASSMGVRYATPVLKGPRLRVGPGVLEEEQDETRSMVTTKSDLKSWCGAKQRRKDMEHIQLTKLIEDGEYEGILRHISWQIPGSGEGCYMQLYFEILDGTFRIGHDRS